MQLEMEDWAEVSLRKSSFFNHLEFECPMLTLESAGTTASMMPVQYISEIF